MPRPTPQQIQSSVQGWDAILNDWFSNLFTTPYPVPEFANLAALPSANLYDRCLAATITPAALYMSDGASWVQIGGGSTPQPFGVHMGVSGLYSPGNNLGPDLVFSAGTLTEFAGRRGTGGAGTTTVQLEINGAPVAGATLSWTNADPFAALKTVSGSWPVAKHDYVSFRILSAETGGNTLVLGVHS